MRRIEIIEGVNEILEAIESSGLDPILSQALRRPKGVGDVSTILLALQHYSISASRFSLVAKEISEILDLHNLLDTKAWALLAAREDGSAEQKSVIYSYTSNIRFAKEFLPKFFRLIRQIPEDFEQKYESEGIITILVPEEEDQFSRVERVVTALEGVASLYYACARLEGVTPDDISLVACDSGGDKSFDVLGLAKVIEAVKEIYLTLWDRVIFFRVFSMQKKIDLVGTSLPVIEKISKMEKEETIGHEEAEILRQHITNGVEKIIRSGSVIPEMGAMSQYDPYVLMAPEPKLLTAPAVAAEPTEKTAIAIPVVEEVASPSISGIAEFDNLSEEDQARLMELLAKMSKSGEGGEEEQGSEEDQGLELRKPRGTDSL
jgi:hypothetical protein